MKDFKEFVEQLHSVQRFLEDLEMAELKGEGTDGQCTLPGCPYCNDGDGPAPPGIWQDMINIGR